MTDKQMQAVLAHVKSGGLVKLRSHGFINDFARLDDEHAHRRLQTA